jgi:hypothetical protein
LVVSIPALAEAPRVFCEVEGCAGASKTYAYRVEAAGRAVTEFVVATCDTNVARYTEIGLPPGWQFTIEETGMDRACGHDTPHGQVSSGPCGEYTTGRVRWWTADPELAIESYTFRFNHPWCAEDAAWQVGAQELFTSDWSAPVGEGAGPVHGPSGSPSTLNLGAEGFVRANGVDITVPGYSVPSFVHWNSDALLDLVVGEGGGDFPGKVRVYLNVGTPTAPEFGEYFYVQSEGADLVVPSESCQGAYPRVVFWDADQRKDLLVGMANGTVKLFLNVADDDAPAFDGGTLLQVGEPGAKVDIDVWARATPNVVDWNNDDRKDLAVGSVDGLIYLFINEGADDAPDFRVMTYVERVSDLLLVPTTRSSPVVLDLNRDGRKDILAGNRGGELVFYANVGADAAPIFSVYSLVRADGVQIDLPGQPRSRPFVCDWTRDGLYDVLLGSEDGKVRLYQGRRELGDFNHDGDVDLEDFVMLAECLGGPYQPIDSGCGIVDVDGDDDVDLADFAGFQRLFAR